MKKILLTTLLAPSLCFALHEKPWFGDFMEFYFLTNYEYNFFNKVDHGEPQLHSTFNTQVLRADVNVTVPDTWNWELELEFADTTPISWGYRSVAFQARKLWLDDVAGDFCSLSTGLVYRSSSARMRRALSTPYHAKNNFELNTAIGKEWSSGRYWFLRCFALAAIGQGTRGYPWLRVDAALLGNYRDQHEWSLFAKSYVGLGPKTIVPTKHFKGWGSIGHQSIDIGVNYRYCLGVYGSLGVDYAHRVFAHSYPENVNFFLLTYCLPLSLF